MVLSFALTTEMAHIHFTFDLIDDAGYSITGSVTETPFVTEGYSASATSVLRANKR